MCSSVPYLDLSSLVLPIVKLFNEYLGIRLIFTLKVTSITINFIACVFSFILALHKAVLFDFVKIDTLLDVIYLAKPVLKCF